MKRIFFCVCFFALLFSCNSDDDTIIVQEPEANFYALTVGNSWVYRSYDYDPDTENYLDSGVIDSVSIVDTEIISGETYFKFRIFTIGNDLNSQLYNLNGENFEFLRESEGSLVDSDGIIKYVNNDYTERIFSVNTWGTLYERLVEGTETIAVEAGTFSCLDQHRYARTPDGGPLPSLDHYYYADGVGLIYNTISFLVEDHPRVIRRLQSYSIL